MIDLLNLSEIISFTSSTASVSTVSFIIGDIPEALIQFSHSSESKALL
jgi:hypothetical protein